MAEKKTTAVAAAAAAEAPADPSGKSVVVEIMTIRDGKTGEMLDKADILAGNNPLPIHCKVKLDSNDSENFGDPAKPEDVRWRLWYGVKLDLECDGHGNVLSGEQAYWWGANGRTDWDQVRGYSACFKLHAGTKGSSTAAIECEHNGVVSNRLEFRCD